MEVLMAIGETRPCRRCHMNITFITGPNGKTIPCQAVRTVYRRAVHQNGEHVVEKVDFGTLFVTESILYVNHYETCPNANEFRAAKKGGQGEKSP
jgi:hypothetical protein